MHRITRRRIVLATAKAFGFTAEEMLDQSKTQKKCRARFAAAYLIRELRPETSFAEIARQLNRADHSTAIHALRRGQLLMVVDTRFQALVERARAMILGIEPTTGDDMPIAGSEKAADGQIEDASRGCRGKQKRQPVPKPRAMSEEAAAELLLRNSEQRLLLALREAHPERECVFGGGR